MATPLATPISSSELARFTAPTAVVVRDKDGIELLRRDVLNSELHALRSEIWLESGLRRGLLDVPLDAVSIEVSPTFRQDATTFQLVATGPRGLSLKREYSVDLLADVATALAQELVAQQRLEVGDTYSWQVVPGAPTATSEASESVGTMSLTSTAQPLMVVRASLAPLLAEAECRGPIDDREMKVFFVRGTLERAERFSRRGADRQPAVETGAAYIGVPASCPETGDLFAVVTDALEVYDAAQQEFSLTYNSTTWNRIRAILQARRGQPGGAALRILGQCHGHNFLPGGGALPCELCDKAATCSRTSVFVSSDDRRWTRAVLAGQPWQLCHIFGFNARKEYLSELFGLRGNRLQPRGYRVIDRFDLSRYEVLS